MNDFFRRGGGGHEPPYARARAPSTFRESLAELRDRVRDGLAEAASRSVSGAVRRAAECLLGDGDDGEDATPERSRHRDRRYDAGWGHGHEDDGFGDGWDDGPWNSRWSGRDDHEQEVPADAADGRRGSWRMVVAACCQAAVSVIRTASPPGWTLGPLACAVPSVLALLLGGSRLACEAGLALAEAAWTLAEALTAGNELDDRQT